MHDCHCAVRYADAFDWTRRSRQYNSDQWMDCTNVPAASWANLVDSPSATHFWRVAVISDGRIPRYAGWLGWFGSTRKDVNSGNSRCILPFVLGLHVPRLLNGTTKHDWKTSNHEVRHFVSKTTKMKKRSERRKQCALAVVRRSQKISPRRRPVSGGAGRPKFNQLWRWSLPLPTNPVWWRSIYAISSYRGNIHRPPATNTDRTDYNTLRRQLARSVISENRKRGGIYAGRVCSVWRRQRQRRTDCFSPSPLRPLIFAKAFVLAASRRVARALIVYYDARINVAIIPQQWSRPRNAPAVPKCKQSHRIPLDGDDAGLASMSVEQPVATAIRRSFNVE